MTVQTNTTVATGIGNGVTSVFPIPFKFNRAEDLIVYLVIQETEEEIPLTLHSDYTVTGAGNENGGNLTMLAGPLPVGQSVVAQRIVDLRQLTDLRNQGRFFAEVHEDVFDKLVMIDQQQQTHLDRAMVVDLLWRWNALNRRIINVGDPIADKDAAHKRYVDQGDNDSRSYADSRDAHWVARTLRTADPLSPLPGPEARASKLLSFDSSGRPIVVAPEPQSATELAMQLADAAQGAAMVGRGVVAVSSPSALANLPEGQRRTDLNYIVSESGTATVWAWLPGDHSRDVAFDPTGNRVIAPSSAPTGASGVFVLRTANSQWDILLSEFPERSLYEHVRDTAICKSNFVHRQVTGINSHIVVGSLQRGRAVGYIFREDGDGLIRIYGGGEGPSTWYGEDIHPTNVSGHYNTPANDRPYFYTVNVGMSFDLEFTGTGLIFYHNADNRGGIWQVQIDGGAPIVISTWADKTGTNYKQSVVAQGLEDTAHVATFTFLGEDPAHPPAGGVPARGWFNMRTDTYPDFYTGRVMEYLGADFVNGEFNRLISQNSVIEFAIRGRPSGTNFSADWCPMHGSVSGVSRGVVYEIWIDGEFFGNSLMDIGLVPVMFTELVIVERYTAYSSGDAGGDAPMWDGSLVWRYKDGELAFSHSMKAVRDCDLLAGGYLFMFASHNGYATRALTGRGFEKPIEQHGVVVEHPLLPSNQYAFVDDTLGNAVAVRVGSTKSYTPPGTEVAAHKDAYFQERDNDVVKFYGMTFPVGSKLSAGDSFSVSWEMAMSVGGWSVL